eukprot:g618.t1
MPASADLVCQNLMCEKLGGACVCRLARFMEAFPLMEFVNLADNAIDVLPDTLWNYSGLRELDLSRNRIEQLSPQVGQLRSLRALHLAGNSIRELPEELSALPALEHLDVRGNPLSASCQALVLRMQQRAPALHVFVD